ncbi:MAG TPA: isoaspartyl peptidase/L-asparaginase [Syntrophorhabdales bacterium]|nr:isoaspartyl peptidase/L-asparaginase [Syntrophorhabdales bacterium]
MISYGVVVHGGVGSPLALSDGCKKACVSAFRLLKKGESALEAVIEAARLLEDDGRYNAGSGSTLRLDGKTVEMDAGLMDSSGHLGTVISVRTVQNPILLAKGVISTPHVALSGQGAELFARKLGLRTFGKPSAKSLEQHRRLLRTIRQGKLAEHDSRWKDFDIKSLWNFEERFNDIMGADTIGAVALDRKGVLAVANSTGGASPMLLGRVGDSPMIGCGFYAGACAAVACTGTGEDIIRRMLARSIYDAIDHGAHVREACRKGVTSFPCESTLGVIAISKEGCAVVSNRQMAHYALYR